MASCYLQLLPAFSHLSSPNQSPHAPGITAWIFPQPKWWSSTSWRLCTIGSWWPLMLSVRSWKTPQLLKSWNPWSLPTTSGLGPGEIKQTLVNRSEGRIFKADSQSPLKKKSTVFMRFYVWNGSQSGIKWVCLICRTYISSCKRGFSCLFGATLVTCKNCIPCYWRFRYLGNDVACDLPTQKLNDPSFWWRYWFGVS